MFGLSNFLTTAHAENYTIEKIINGIDVQREQSTKGWRSQPP